MEVENLQPPGLGGPPIAQENPDPGELVLETSGAGHTLLCLHGVGGCAAWFQGLAMRLQNRFRVIALDLPGTGANRNGTAPFSIDRCADALAAHIVRNEAGPISILGHSLGTILALRLAETVPDRLRSLVFAGGLPEATASSRVRLAERRKKILDKGMAGLGWSVALGNFSAASLVSNPECLAFFARLWELQSQSAYVEGIDSLVDFSSDGHWRSMKVPCLVLRGSEDSYAPLEESLRFANALPGPARYVELEKCAHMAFLERPAEFSAAVADFLDAYAGSAVLTTLPGDPADG